LIYDTKYFWTLYHEKDPKTIRRLKKIYNNSPTNIVSVITIYEIYKLTITNEGKDVAIIRTGSIKNGFEIVGVDANIAEEGARISVKSKKPMADSLIIGTARKLNQTCVTDDPHFQNEVKTVWI